MRSIPGRKGEQGGSPAAARPDTPVFAPMPAATPCPICGTELEANASACTTCGYRVDSSSPVGPRKCARCGTPVGEGDTWCSVCGLDLRLRHPRPATRAINVRSLGGPSASGPLASATPTVGEQPRGGLGVGSGGPSSVAGSAPVGLAGVALAPTMQQGGVPPSAAPPVYGAGLQAPSGGAAPLHPAASPPVAPPQAAPANAVAPGGAGAASSGRDAAHTGWGRAAGPGVSLVVVRKDGTEGESFPIGTGLEIGRAGTKMIFANDPFISPRHVRCSLDGERLHLVDLSSRNGVYIRIGGAEVVYPGDLILLGNRLLRLDVLPTRAPVPADTSGTRSFGTPLDTAWGRVLLVGVDEVMTDVYELRGNPVAIGREVGDIVFPKDAFLSRSHCRLRMEVGGGSVRVLLEDAGSANGTYLRMRSEAWLGDGDMFRIGDQILKVRAG